MTTPGQTAGSRSKQHAAREPLLRNTAPLKHRKGPPAMAAIVIADLKMATFNSGYGGG